MESGETTTDVLIVGTGPVGATFGRLLGSSGRRVVMLDTGSHLSAQPGRHLANVFIYQQQPNLFLDVIASHLEVFSVPPTRPEVPPPPSFIPKSGRINFQNPDQDPAANMPFASASYCVGGMGTHWTCCTPDPSPAERTPIVPADEWDLLLSIARQLLNVHTDAFTPSFTGDAIKTILRRSGCLVEDLPMAAEKRGAHSAQNHMVTWTGTDTVLGPLVDPSAGGTRGLTVLAEHRAEQLLLSGQKVTGATVRDLTNLTTKKIFADTVVVAAGPFLTPRLLWQSGIRPYALGRFLNANNCVSATVTLSREVTDRLRQNSDNPARRDPIPMAWTDPPVNVGFSPTAGKPWHAQIQRFGQYVSYDFGVMQPPTDVRLVVNLIWYGMIQPSADNRIVFSEDVQDRFGQPQITIQYKVSEQDRISAGVLMEDLAAAAQAIGVYVPKTDVVPKGGAPRLTSPGSTLHYQGTCRMGDDGGQASVVDSHAKVWGYDNLYLGSVGVIPVSMASNPTLTACALAARSSARILGVSLPDLARSVGMPSEVHNSRAGAE